MIDFEGPVHRLLSVGKRLVREALHPGVHYFDVEGYEVSTKVSPSGSSASTAS